MATEVLAWDSPPTLTDAVDSGQTYSMGIRFSVVASVACRGIQWRVPDTVSAPPLGTHFVTLWRVSDATLLATKAFTPTPGVYQDVMFDAPVTIAVGLDYIAAVYTQHYVFHASGGSYPKSPSLNSVGDQGRLAADSSGVPANTFPAGVFNAWYYVSPITDTPGATTTPFSKDYSLLARVLNGFTKDYTLNARVLNGFSKDVVLQARVLNTFSKDVVLLADVAAATAFSKDVVLLARVLAGWQVDYVLPSRVLAGWQRDYALNSRVRNGFAVDVVLRAGVQGLWAVDYVLRARVLSADPPTPLPADVVADLEHRVVANVLVGSVTAYLD